MNVSPMIKWIAKCLYCEAKRRGLREDMEWGRHNNILYGVWMELGHALDDYFKAKR